MGRGRSKATERQRRFLDDPESIGRATAIGGEENCDGAVVGREEEGDRAEKP